jgi:hypothetical protein
VGFSRESASSAISRTGHPSGGIAKQRKGDKAGGDADIAKAKLDPKVGQQRTKRIPFL